MEIKINITNAVRIISENYPELSEGEIIKEIEKDLQEQLECMTEVGEMFNYYFLRKLEKLALNQELAA